MSEWERQHSALNLPIVADIAMYGGPRAGKTSLLAGMYSAVAGEARAAGLEMRRRDMSTIRALDEAADALEALPNQVRADPLLSSGAGVVTTPEGEVRQFDFILHGADVDVAALRFYDFCGEDIEKNAKVVQDGMRAADVLLVAINTPPMMEAYADSDLDGWHKRVNVPDQLDIVLGEWVGRVPMLVMFCPIKCERWLHDADGGKLVNEAVHRMYAQTFSILGRPKFADTTVVIAPVETVGSVHYDGYQLYDPAQPVSKSNVFPRWRTEEGGRWSPHHHEQPFRWTLLGVAKAVRYGTIAAGTGGSWWQKALAVVGDWYLGTGLPKIHSVEQFWRDQTGLQTFLSATETLAEGRKLDPPFELVQAGALTRPVQR